jgi:hypothetical protein
MAPWGVTTQLHGPARFHGTVTFAHGSERRPGDGHGMQQRAVGEMHRPIRHHAARIRPVPSRSWRDHRPADLGAMKAKLGITVSVCLPARNEAATVGTIVAAIRTA